MKLTKEIVFWSKEHGYKYFENPTKLNEFLCEKRIFVDESTDIYFVKQLEVNNLVIEDYERWDEENNYDKERDFFIEEKQMRDLTEEEYFEAIQNELFSISDKYSLIQRNIIPDDIKNILEDNKDKIDEDDFEDFKDELLDTEIFKTKDDMIKAINKAIKQ